MLSKPPTPPDAATTWLDRRLARWALVSFVFTFAAARTLVFLIMSRRVPDLYFYVGQTHVHHLNYGIFLMAGVAGYLLLVRQSRPARTPAAIVYGVALGLTFDEFGMWVHLGGGYWQWASFHACVMVAAFLSLLAVAPRWETLRARHWTVLALMLVAAGVFFALLADASNYYRRFEPRLMQLEEAAPQ